MKNSLFAMMLCIGCLANITSCSNGDPKSLTELVAQRGLPDLVAKNASLNISPQGFRTLDINGAVYEPEHTNQWWNKEVKVLVYVDSGRIKRYAKEYYRERAAVTNFNGHGYEMSMKGRGENIFVVEFSTSDSIKTIRTYRAQAVWIQEGLR